MAILNNVAIRGKGETFIGKSIALSMSLLYTEFMKTWLKCIILGALFLSSPLLAQEELPFWRKKQNLYTKIIKERKIVVSATDFSLRGQSKKRFVGAGLVHASLEKVLGEVVQFENLLHVSSYFKKVVHKKDQKQVYFLIQALGYQSRFLLSYKWGIRNKNQAQLDWIVSWGRLQGMVGHFKFESVEKKRTIMSVWTRLPEVDLPLPNFLMNFTLEVIAEKVAQKMRTYIETKHSKKK